MNRRRILFAGFLALVVCSGLGVQEHIERKAMISTEFGDMIVKLCNETPRCRDNFIQNVESGVCQYTLFHRVIPLFMMQGGDQNSIDAAPGTGTWT